MMTPNELLKPRFKVIADYPDRQVELNEILIGSNTGIFEGLISGTLMIGSDLNKYPHLFKKLEWWQDREESDMPEYIVNQTGEVRKMGDFLKQYNGFLGEFNPSTKEEYEIWKSEQK